MRGHVHECANCGREYRCHGYTDLTSHGVLVCQVEEARGSLCLTCWTTLPDAVLTAETAVQA